MTFSRLVALVSIQEQESIDIAIVGEESVGPPCQLACNSIAMSELKSTRLPLGSLRSVVSGNEHLLDETA